MRRSLLRGSVFKLNPPSIRYFDLLPPIYIEKMDAFRHVMELVGTAIDAVGVLVVVAGALYASARFVFHREQLPATPYRIYRQNIGRAILLGLEFLVAGDIIRTVVVSPTITNVLALGLIVLIRTFLSMSLEVELEGRWPWQRDVTQPGIVSPAKR